MKNAKNKWNLHRLSAASRGIPFELSFEEWLDIWVKSGHWNERGRKAGQYCMSRYGDVGPYSKDNVFIQLASDNSRQIYHPPMSDENRRRARDRFRGKTASSTTREKRSKSLLGHSVSVETRQKISKANTGRSLSTETREKLSKALTGRKLNEATRQRMQESAKIAWAARKGKV